MKRGYLLLIISIFLVSTSLLVTAQNESEEISDVDKAYDCLIDKLDKCSSLSSEEKIFSLLSVGKCKTEVMSDSSNRECWPKSDCNLKTTSQAVLALSDSEKPEAWLLNQNKTPEELEWFLQIESPESTTCEILYDSSPYQISIADDKKINSGAGSCLTLSSGAYWLRISPACYEKKFEVSCDTGFLTNLLYKKKTSSTIHVPGTTNSAAAEGTTTEKVNSVCFGEDNSCNYEGSLWAAFALKNKGYDISNYLPYLITMADENYPIIPESFLYSLTGYINYKTTLLLKQKSTYWKESDDKFYDTALALLPFQNQELPEKTKSINWLLDSQDNDGCWEGNIRNTAFLLYSLWPRTFISDEPGLDCKDSGYFCMSEIDCQGRIFPDYDCAGISKCCDSNYVLESCRDLSGEVCNSNEVCSGGITSDSSDTEYGESCCVGGSCIVPAETPECELNNGNCRSYECDEGETESSDSCDSTVLTCCKEKTKSEFNYFWIWLLIILIILVIIAIIFKDKLRVYWFRVKSKFKRKPSVKTPPRGFPPQGRRIPPRMQRRILPPTQPRRQPKKVKPSKELDNVLKKLKEMGK